MHDYNTMTLNDEEYRKAFNKCHTHIFKKLKLDGNAVDNHGVIFDQMLEEYGIEYVLMARHIIRDEEKFLRFKLEWY